MKKVIALALLGWLVGVLSAQTADDWTNLIELERKTRTQGHISFANPVTDRAGGDGQADITYARFHWWVDPALRFITGEILYRMEPQQNLSNWTLDLSDGLVIDQISWHNQSIPYTYAGNTLTLHFPQPLPLGLPDSVQLTYHGVPPDSGFGSFTTTTHADVPVLWTLSEPYGARDWFPCQQDLNDKIDSCDIFISAPAGNHPASNGLRVSETSSNGVTTAHWRTRYPMAAYLVCMAVTNYAVYEQQAPFGSQSTLVQNFVYPEKLAQAQNETTVIVPQLQLYDSLFGMYPFQAEKYGHAQFNWGGGMEHQTMTFVVNFNFELLAHELAHHWFGDKVTCGSWEDIWLNESFATYLAGLCYERLQPQGWRPYRKVRLDGVVSQPGGSVRVNDTTDVNRIFSGRLSYAKGALVLHQLRWLLGDPAFFAGLRAYINDPVLAYGYARTEDLRGHLETASGRNLGWYFNQWYAGQGFPSYQLQWVQDFNKKLTLTLGQTTSVPASVAFFPLPVPVLAVGFDGQDSLLVLDHTFPGQQFQVTLPFAVDSLVFDPDLWLISANNTISKTTALRELPEGVLDWSVSPNPAQDRLTVRLDAAKAGPVQLRLLAADGRVLKQQLVHVVFGRNDARFDLGDLPSGSYQLVLQGGTRAIATTVLKQ